MIRHEEEAYQRNRKARLERLRYKSAQYRRKEIIKGIKRGVCGFNFTCFQTVEEAIADLQNIEVITFRTQEFGYNMNHQPGQSSTYDQDNEEKLIEAPIITIDELSLALHDKMKGNRPFYQRAWQPDIEKWLNKCREAPGSEILQLGDKDYPTRSYKWSIKYQLKDKEESDNVESRATSRG